MTIPLDIKLSELVGHSILTVDYVTLKRQAVEYLNLYPIKHEIFLPRQLVGIEIEIENCPGVFNDEDGPSIPNTSSELYRRLTNAQLWNVIKDGSLRNHGIELVSVPMKGPMIIHALHSALNSLSAAGGQFTERTSIHVHVNCRHRTIAEISNILLLYMAIEKPLYRFIEVSGINRYGNIFCTPLNEHLPNEARELILGYEKGGAGEVLEAIRSWKKYTGLNLAPLYAKGTLEFRQMSGTYNLSLILKWINIIQRLVHAAGKYEYPKLKEELINLNTNSMYGNFIHSIFGPYAHDILSANLQDEMEHSLFNVKNILAPKDRRKVLEENLFTKLVDKYKEYNKLIIDEVRNALGVRLKAIDNYINYYGLENPEKAERRFKEVRYWNHCVNDLLREEVFSLL